MEQQQLRAHVPLELFRRRSLEARDHHEVIVSDAELSDEKADRQCPSLKLEKNIPANLIFLARRLRTPYLEFNAIRVDHAPRDAIAIELRQRVYSTRDGLNGLVHAHSPASFL